ncbi:MAG: pyrroline-5-carboxylate reductase [Spirochaetes bacterium]|nr:pyrroline-5-carboxylate reductase [Spirochaetota bacterium]
MKNILFIGAGNMGQSIIRGIIHNKILSPEKIFIYEPLEENRHYVMSHFKVQSLQKIDDQISQFDVVVLAVKPTIFLDFKRDETMHKLAAVIKEKQMVISIMAGITIQTMKEFFINDPVIIRTMPNTPALIGEAMTVLSADKKTTADNLENAKKIFSSIGEVEILQEKFLDAVTGLSGTGPAYVFLFIESLIQGGVLCGLSRKVSQKLVIQTLVGSAKMIEEEQMVEELRHAVTTPGGTTIEALTLLDNRGFRGMIADAVKAATDKSRNLSHK